MTSAAQKTKAKAIQKAYGKAYGGGHIGAIEGGDGATVTLQGNALSFNVLRPEEFGCPAGELALLVRYVETDPPDDAADLVTFPIRFRKLRVYYKKMRGRIVAQ